ncbi:nitroreductase family deazaflavin-dependent oxidoreductase [Mycobacterium simiae]|uniref:nitroreductase family deazaflavin-dependent oxidoreductase n=1 Tax=Mycobacterium simiae TaxID=1784 RepID=UPI000429A860|nr:nitroreductase family deazaflavin-dependent oxidoreductase [Mycobacterium simiae]
MAIIEHTGRKSGKSYQTPVVAFVVGGTLSEVLNYGTKSDWVRNVESAGSAPVVHQGKRYELTSPRILPLDSAEPPPAVRVIRGPTRSALHATLTPP